VGKSMRKRRGIGESRRDSGLRVGESGDGIAACLLGHSELSTMRVGATHKEVIRG